MATVIISNLPPAPSGTGSGSSQGTDLFPATDTTDTTSAASGTTKKYTLSEIYNFMLNAEGLTTYSATRVATTAAFTATYNNGTSGLGATLTNAGVTTPLVVDGVTLAVGNRVLVKNQSSTFQNGIYTVTSVGSLATNWVMTRSLDYDTPAEIVQYGVVLSNQGTVNAGLLWQETAPGPFTIGTSPITFAPYASHSFSFPITLAEGGTSASLTADNGGIFYSTASAGAILAGTSVAGRVLQSGANTDPFWSTPTYPNTSGAVGRIIRSDGTNNVYSTSTFSDTYALNAILYASTANTVTGLSAVNNAAMGSSATGIPTWFPLTDGQLLIGATGTAPAAGNLTAGAGISITNAANSITITATGGGIGWSTIAGTTQAAAINQGYVVGNAAQTTITLPATFAVGSNIQIKGLGAGGWILQAQAGDTIAIGTTATSSGGTLTSVNANDGVSVTAIVANTTWVVDYTNSAGLTVA